MVLIDSYSEINQDYDLDLTSNHPSPDIGKSAGGQSFTNLAAVYKITSVKFYMKKSGAPTGNGHAVLYAHSGTYGVDSEPTGSALATSDAFDISTLGAAYALITFSFTGAEQYSMQPGVKYCIAFENPAVGNIDSEDHPSMGGDVSSPGHDGNLFWWSLSLWTGTSAGDMCFYVYGDLVVAGWTGKISGVTNPAEIAGVAVANIAEVKGVA